MIFVQEQLEDLLSKKKILSYTPVVRNDHVYFQVNYRTVFHMLHHYWNFMQLNSYHSKSVSTPEALVTTLSESMIAKLNTLQYVLYSIFHGILLLLAECLHLTFQLGWAQLPVNTVCELGSEYTLWLIFAQGYCSIGLVTLVNLIEGYLESDIWVLICRRCLYWRLILSAAQARCKQANIP